MTGIPIQEFVARRQAPVEQAPLIERVYQDFLGCEDEYGCPGWGVAAVHDVYSAVKEAAEKQMERHAKIYGESTRKRLLGVLEETITEFFWEDISRARAEMGI